MLAIVMLLLPVLAFVIGVRAQGQFVVPPATGALHDYSENPTYTVGDRLNIQWKSTAPIISLWLWQNDNPTVEVLLDSVKNTGSLSWKIATNKDYSKQSGTNGTVFFMQIVAGGGVNGQIGSHYFNVTGPLTPSSSSSSSTSPTSAATSSTTKPTTVTTKTTDGAAQTSSTATPIDGAVSSHNPSADSANKSGTPTPAPGSSATDHSALAIGLGVALGLVFAGLIGAMIYILVRRRRAKAARQLAQHHEEMAQQNLYQGIGGGVGNSKSISPPPPVYAGAGGYYAPAGEKQQPALVEIMDRRQTHNHATGMNGESTWVHEMGVEGNGTARGLGNARHISGVHEMPVRTSGHSNGIFNEEG